jgi:1,4-dihydroxy-2-naphthoyl-CoA hydrolase
MWSATIVAEVAYPVRALPSQEPLLRGESSALAIVDRPRSIDHPGEHFVSIWKQTTDLDRINGWNRNTLVEHLGMLVTEVGDDFVRGTMPVDARTKQPFGLLHGGASVALAESLGSLAGNLCIDTSEMAVGLDINANHVRAATSGVVTGTARVLHLGRTTQVWEIRIEDERARLVCISRLTLAVVPRPSPHAI